MQRLPQCHWWMAFSRPSSKYNYGTDSKFHLSRDLEQWRCRIESTPVTGLFKTCFWVKISAQRLYLSGNLKNECEIVFPGITSLKTAFSKLSVKWNNHITEQWMCRSFPGTSEWSFRTIFWVKLTYWLEGLFPGRPEQWLYRAISFPGFPMNGHFKIFWA